MTNCLQRLGIRLTVAKDPREVCNRTLTVTCLNGRIAEGGTTEAPLELFVANAGTAARFLTALACLGQGVYRISGVPRMHERPQFALSHALRQLGYVIEAKGD